MKVDKKKTIYEFDNICECGHKWGKILVEFKPNETTKVVNLTCPDCKAKRELTLTKRAKGNIPIKGVENKNIQED